MNYIKKYKVEMWVISSSILLIISAIALAVTYPLMSPMIGIADDLMVAIAASSAVVPALMTVIGFAVSGIRDKRRMEQERAIADAQIENESQIANRQMAQNQALAGQNIDLSRELARDTYSITVISLAVAAINSGSGFVFCGLLLLEPSIRGFLWSRAISICERLNINNNMSTSEVAFRLFEWYANSIEGYCKSIFEACCERYERACSLSASSSDDRSLVRLESSPETLNLANMTVTITGFEACCERHERACSLSASSSDYRSNRVSLMFDQRDRLSFSDLRTNLCTLATNLLERVCWKSSSASVNVASISIIQDDIRNNDGENAREEESVQWAGKDVDADSAVSRNLQFGDWSISGAKIKAAVCFGMMFIASACIYSLSPGSVLQDSNTEVGVWDDRNQCMANSTV